MGYMIVNQNKTNLESMNEFHKYLYELTEENHELLNIYDNINNEVDELEGELADMENEVSSAESDKQEVRSAVETLIDDIDDNEEMSREDILEELRRILF